MEKLGTSDITPSMNCKETKHLVILIFNETKSSNSRLEKSETASRIWRERKILNLFVTACLVASATEIERNPYHQVANSRST